ncbi:MAG: RpiB/LacA/LacB family sugar-phosphate isomerase [Gemmatimonadaceae bacterium]
MKERIPIAADHAGYEMKTVLAEHLVARGFDVQDLGTNSLNPTDYPDFAHPIARDVSSGIVRRGVLLCGSGQGMAMAANRHPHVRAALVWNREIAALASAHNDANILVIPSRCVSHDEARAMLDAWLDTPFEDGRHTPRVAKIDPPEE